MNCVRNHDHRADDRVGQPADLGLRRRRRFREHLKRQAAKSQTNGLEQDPQQPEDPEGHGGQRQHQGDGIHHLAPPVDGHATGVHRRDGVHDRLPSPRFMRASISRDRLSTTKVMRNRISPR